jgi:hypothetical protein
LFIALPFMSGLPRRHGEHGDEEEIRASVISVPPWFDSRRQPIFRLGDGLLSREDEEEFEISTFI